MSELRGKNLLMEDLFHAHWSKNHRQKKYWSRAHLQTEKTTFEKRAATTKDPHRTTFWSQIWEDTHKNEAFFVHFCSFPSWIVVSGLVGYLCPCFLAFKWDLLAVMSHFIFTTLCETQVLSISDSLLMWRPNSRGEYFFNLVIKTSDWPSRSSCCYLPPHSWSAAPSGQSPPSSAWSARPGRRCGSCRPVWRCRTSPSLWWTSDRSFPQDANFHRRHFLEWREHNLSFFFFTSFDFLPSSMHLRKGEVVPETALCNRFFKIKSFLSWQWLPGSEMHSWLRGSHWQFWSTAQLLQLVFLLHTYDGLSLGQTSNSPMAPWGKKWNVTSS